MTDHRAASQQHDEADGYSVPPKFGLGEDKPIEIGSNTPIRLDDPETIWLVYDGWVDVFAVQMANQQITGARQHLFRATTGEILMGFDLHEYGNIVVTAVGTRDSVIARLSRERFEGLLHDPDYDVEMTGLLNTWITHLSTGVARSTALRRFVPLRPGEPIDLKSGEITRPVKGVLWTYCVDGSAQFMGKPELPLITPDDLLPVSEATWLSTIRGATVYAVTTEMLLQENFSWIYIHNFHRIMLNTLIWSIEYDADLEHERLKRRTEYDRVQLDAAYERLASILQPDLGAVFSSDYGEDEALLAACKIVGDAMRIPIQRPPDLVDGREQTITFDKIMHASNIRSREVALRGRWWRKDNGPLLGFLGEEKRPVALIPSAGGRYEIHDPTTRTKQLVNRDIVAQLSDRAQMFYRVLPNRPVVAWDLLKFGLRHNRRDLMIIFIMGIAGGVLGTFIPLITGRIFDLIIPTADRSQLVEFSLLLLATAFASALFMVVRSIAMLRVEIKMDSVLQAAVWDRLLKLPTPFFRRFSAGDLSFRAMGINTIRRAASGTVVLAVLSSIFSVFNFLLLFYYDAGLGLVATGLVLLAVVVTLFIGYRQMRYQRELADVQGRISGMVLQLITGIAKLRIAGVEGRAFAQWTKRFSLQKKLSYQAGDVENTLAVFNATYPIITSIVIYAMVLNTQGLTTGEFLAFNAAFTQFLLAGLEFGTAFVLVLRVVPDYERMKPILNTIPEVDETKADPGELSGEIELSRVSFHYKEDGPLILKNVSFQVKPGDFIALVGPSGSGKSTLLRLLLGFEHPETGSIFYDGQDLSGLDIRSVRQQLGVVLQNSQLMTGDIFTNIVGVSQMGMDEAWDAARMAGLAHDIEQMPMGMHTIVSEGGSTLSGGQRQRLLIARAIAKKPKILFFDEATSALDNRTQAIVSQSLESLDATRIVIAHRLSTIINADLILVLDHGEMVQSGTYQELIRHPGMFADLAKRQLV